MPVLNARDGDGARDDEMDREIERVGGRQRGEPVGLGRGPWEPVEDDAAADGGRDGEALGHQADDQVVGNRFPPLDCTGGCQTERGRVADGRPQERPGRDVLEAEPPRQARRLLALA